ncbi:MAG: tetratricopeptide repeat protein [Burkholderiaceae bacterium]|nr:tetratricopeptide repeat protein [Burkholderiaceae bacterium]
MSKFRLAHLGLLAALLGQAAPVFLGASTAYAADTLRPEVGTPLKAAQDDIKKGKFKEALAKVHEAEAASGRTAYENYVIDSMRASAAQGAGDNETAAKSFEAVLASGKVTGAAQTRIVQTLADTYYRAGQYPKAIVWITRYLSEGGDDPAMHALLVSAYYASGDFARAAKEVSAQVQADEKAGRVPTEQQLQLLQSCALKLGDKAGYLAAVEKLAAYHPKKEIWTEILNKLENKPGFNDSRLGLDVKRMRLKVNAISTASDFMDMAELALQAGYPGEAKKIIDAAYKSGAFGTGAEAGRQKRLQDLALKKLDEDIKALPQAEAEASKAKDGNALLSVGYEYVSNGQFDKGIALIEQGIAKGELKHPDDAKLHLGLAYLQADKKAKALAAFKTVQGTDGTAELAHYWTILTNHPLN